jgi:arylsulfatase A-like enzyme
MKCNLTDAGCGVSLIMRGPGGFTGGKLLDAMVSHIDLFPTLCELIGVERPAWLEGQSMMPLLRGERTEIRDELFAEVNYHASYEPKRMVRTQRWKYIRRYDHRTSPVLPNCDDGPSKSLWLRNGWKPHQPDEEALYDLMFDPNEQRNLAGDAAHEAALHEMRGRLERWMRSTDDPLLRGPVAAPHGAQVNDPDGTSPKETPITLA